MTHSLIWLPSVLEAAGLKVATIDGWETRGRGNVGQIFGVICHHTAGARFGNMPSLETLIKGRPDLNGPLAQLGLGRDGTFYVIAAGRCNHAGEGVWKGLRNGNSNFIGIEAENTGLGNDFPYPAVQMDAYLRGTAAILKHIGRDPDFCAGHKEFALPLGRKPDPIFDMNSFRNSIGSLLNDNLPLPVLIPAVSSDGLPTFRRGAANSPVALVKKLQVRIGVVDDGDFGGITEAAVRAFQRNNNLVPDGIVGPKTWGVLGIEA